MGQDTLHWKVICVEGLVQPSLSWERDELSIAPRSTAWCGVVRHGAERCGVALCGGHRGTAQDAVMRSGAVIRCTAVRRAWHGAVRRGVRWSSTAPCGAAQCDAVLCVLLRWRLQWGTAQSRGYRSAEGLGASPMPQQWATAQLEWWTRGIRIPLRWCRLQLASNTRASCGHRNTHQRGGRHHDYRWYAHSQRGC